jgi:predicted NBD/HSP70 family sugar kinase
MATLGIDVGGMSVKAALINQGNCIWTGQSSFYRKPSAAQLADAIRQAVIGPIGEVQSIGLCVPGIMDAEKRQITLAINVPGLVGLSLDRLVPDALGLGFRGRSNICNDAYAAAADIHASRSIEGRLLILSLGTGVGACVLDNGRPLYVEGNSPGHIGQLDVSVPGHEIIAPDGGAGGLEGYIGAAALKGKYGENLSDQIARWTGNEISLQALARAIRISHAIYRPNHICLTGGIGIRLQHVLQPLRKIIETNLTSLARTGWTLTSGDDDFHAARGAARLAADKTQGIP